MSSNSGRLIADFRFFDLFRSVFGDLVGCSLCISSAAHVVLIVFAGRAGVSVGNHA